MATKDKIRWTARALWGFGALFALMACICLAVFAFGIDLTAPLKVQGSYRASDGIGWQDGSDFFLMINSMNVGMLKHCAVFAIISAVSMIVSKALALISRYKK